MLQFDLACFAAPFALDALALYGQGVLGGAVVLGLERVVPGLLRVTLEGESLYSLSLMATVFITPPEAPPVELEDEAGPDRPPPPPEDPLEPPPPPQLVSTTERSARMRAANASVPFTVCPSSSLVSFF